MRVLYLHQVICRFHTTNYSQLCLPHLRGMQIEYRFVGYVGRQCELKFQVTALR